jgi:putative ABC transport system permease protein
MDIKSFIVFIFRISLKLRYRLLAIVLTLALGLMGLLFLNVVSTSFQASLNTKAKQLLSSDLAVGARRFLTETEKTDLKTFMHDKIEQSTETIEMFSMLRTQDQQYSRLVEIMAVGAGYPIYGNIDLKSTGTEKRPLPQDQIWISQDLSFDYKKEAYVGQALLPINDIVIDASTISWRGVGLAPRIYLGIESLKKTGLIGKGSTLYQTFHYQLKPEWMQPDKLALLKQDILNKLTDPSVQVTTPSESSEQVSRMIRYLIDYLGLVSLSALFLSAVGCVYLFRGHLFSMMKSIAVFRVLGLTPKLISRMFVVQLIMVATLASVFALLFAAIAFPQLESLLSQALKSPLSLNLTLDGIVSIFAISLLVGTLSCYPQIQHFAGFKLTALLAEDDQYNRGSLRTLLYKYIPALIIFYALSVWLAHSWVMGSVFFGLFIFSGLLLFMVANLIMRLIERRLQKRHLVLDKFALLSLIRNPHTTTLSFVSLGLGVLLLSIVSLVEVAVHSEFSYDEKSDIPELFLFDIQDEQVEQLKQMLQQEQVAILQSSPLVRARLARVNGEEFKRRAESEFETREEERSRRFNNRGINLTYANQLNRSEELVDGVFPARTTKPEAEAAVSLEERYAKRMGLKIGDTIEFDILGVPVKTEITSLRKVKWTSFLPNFFVLFSGDSLLNAPKTFLMAVKSPVIPRSQLQSKIVKQFPNISCIDVVQATQKITQIFSQMAVALKVMALFCLLVGLLVLFAIARDMIDRRQGQVALMKMMGLSSAKIFSLTMQEFFMLCYSSIFLGIVVSYGMVTILLAIFFDGGLIFDIKSFIFLTLLVPLIFFMLLSHLIYQVLRKSTVQSLVYNT